MARPRSTPALVLAGWTGLVWTTRIRNIFGDDELDLGGRIWRLGLALSFTVLAVSVVWAALRRAGRLGPAVLALAAWTTLVWVVRAVDIAAGDHSVGFVVVHLVLAVVSIALAVVATRSVATFRDGFSVAARDR